MPNKNSPRLKGMAEAKVPPIAIGHVTLRVSDVGLSADFYRALGLRPVLERAELAILELRGGTHLVLFRAEGKPEAGPVRAFDFMVEDVEAAHAAMGARGSRARPSVRITLRATSGSRLPTPTATC